MQGLFKFQAIAGITYFLMFYEYLTILSVVALLAEHSFWFCGSFSEEQFPHAVKSFKSQKQINIAIAAVETAFNNASDKEHPAWLIQWISDNKLVWNIILYPLFKTLTCLSEAQIVFPFKKSNHGWFSF